ncbi:hypothetical protein NE237_032282 [Protea cynaroides]|uniref:Metallo-beta-lactamase domain-containing protein n=1 Tax=Protea cynaroides TaxID=273540 RepID=A0A9Q0R2Y1_9MAGN|nr:hypothetical protein NE237_032282 [Protea cynaroides]
MQTVLTDNGSCSKSQSGDDRHGSSALIFLGTSCSSMLPHAMCLIQPTDSRCSVCSQDIMIPPECNPNYRCNTSLLIDYSHGDREHKYVLIDVGKNFREQVIRWFTCHKIPSVDSIILSREHADAVFGLDDIRSVQPFSATNDIDPTPIYLPYSVFHGQEIYAPVVGVTLRKDHNGLAANTTRRICRLNQAHCMWEHAWTTSSQEYQSRKSMAIISRLRFRATPIIGKIVSISILIEKKKKKKKNLVAERRQRDSRVPYEKENRKWRGKNVGEDIYLYITWKLESAAKPNGNCDLSSTQKKKKHKN